MRIGVLTGGGDCPGLNAAIRAVVLRSLEHGHSVLGIHHGWLGLMGAGDVSPLDASAVSDILPMGGTILGTSRTNPLRNEAHLRRVLENIKTFGLEAIVAIGGDDTLSVAARLHELGVPVVGIPKTVDNDLGETEVCIGFDSAVTTVMEALDKLHTTATAHHRVMVVEVMGRDAGWVAVMGGLAGGADYIAIPEEPTTIDRLCQHVRDRWAAGKESSIIVVAEGATIEGVSEQAILEQRDAFGHVRLEQRGIAAATAYEIERRTGFETRVSVLGHLQRGGSPTSFDRVLATRLGAAAADLINERKFGYMVALKSNKMVPVPIHDAIRVNRKVDRELIDLAKTFFRPRVGALRHS